VKEIASTVVRIKTEMRKASAKPKKDNSQADLFEDEGGRRYSRAYRRSKEKELQAKRKSGGPKVMGKAQFASRSEAGRYAANMRWKGQGAKTPTASAGSKTPKQKYDFSPQDYKMVRDAMPQLSAADAKKLTQHLLDNNAFGDTSEMSNQEMSNEFALYLDDALGGGGSSASSEPKGKAPALVDRLRDITDNNVNDNGESLDDLNSRYQNDNEYIPFEELPQGGFREDVIAAFIDRKAANYYDEPGRLKGPYDRPSSQMTDKGYAKARAHALKGTRDNSPSELDEYWDDNSSIFWDEYAMITDQYSTNE